MVRSDGYLSGALSLAVCNSQQINLVSSPLYHLHTATCRDCRDSGDNFIGEIYSARAASQLYLPEWISDCIDRFNKKLC